MVAQHVETHWHRRFNAAHRLAQRHRVGLNEALLVRPRGEL
jgi:predicted amidophosphoribosyltransferase